MFCCAIHGMDLPAADYRLLFAVHEAGHAVAAFRLGVHVPSVGITLSHRTLPCGTVEDVNGANEGVVFADVTVRTALTVLAAGEAAERRWLREADLYTPTRAFFTERGGVGDRLAADRLLMENFGRRLAFGTSTESSPDSADWWRYGPLADVVLDEVWPQVHELAAAIVLRGSLSGDQAAAVSGMDNPAPS